MMNILGLVSAILIIFSIISSYMLKQHAATSEISRCMKGYYLADMESQNAFEKAIFDSQKKMPSEKRDPSIQPSKKEKKDPSKKEEKKEKKKKTAKIYSCSSLNILPLIKNDKAEEKELLELFVNLIKVLYQQELSKEKANNLADSLILACKKKYEANEELQLEKIDLKNPSLQALWYKMLKGTKGYDFEKNVGLPSILSFICLDEKENKICVTTSSKEMLTVLFNKKIADKIWEKRKKDKIKISKEELEKILKENISPIYNPNIWKHISLSHSRHKKKARLTICKDDTTQISIQRVPREQ